MTIRQKLPIELLSLSELLLEQVNEMGKELGPNNSSLRALSPRTIKFWQQMAYLICTWSRNGRTVEVAGTPIMLRRTTRALIAEASQINLPYLINPLSMSDAHWLLLENGLRQLKITSPPIWFRLETRLSVKNYK